MSTLKIDLGTKLKAFGHYIEQPDVIAKAQKTIPIIGGLGLAALGGMDVYKAKPEERKKVAVRDTLVLGSTAIGTVLGVFLMGMNFNRKKAFEEMGEAFEKPLKEITARGYGHLEKALNEMLTTKKTRSELEQLIQEIKNGKGDKAKGKKDLEKIFPVDLDKTDWKQLFRFFGVGLISVLSGLGGGYAANKINKVTDPDANVNMVKEGIFQFIANIALCAVGAAAALAVLSTKKVKGLLLKTGGLAKPLRTLGICAGLSVGILGGGVAANWLGRNYINPWFDKLQGKAPQPGQGKRKVEFSDAILHLDDLPTALALAGVKIMEPFIPLFFAFSGYRTGIGYRNDHNASAAPKESKSMPSLASSFGPADLGAMAPAPSLGNAAPNPAAQPGISPLSALAAAPIGAFAASRPASPFAAASSQLASGAPSFQPQPQPAGI